MGYRPAVIRAREGRWLAALALTSLLAGCRKPAAHDRSVAAAAPVGARVEVQLTAPGLSAAQLEAEVLPPLEAGLRDVANLRHVNAEAAPGRARVELELRELGEARADVAARVRALEASLPAFVERPTRVAGAEAEAEAIVATIEPTLPSGYAIELSEAGARPN